MTRPPSTPGFAQFFPTAPKVRAEAQGRGDRERSIPETNGLGPSRDQAHEHDSPLESASRLNGGASSGAPRSHHQQRADANESPPGDIPGTGDSASSHASTVSSVFSNARPAATHASSRHTTATATPVTSKGSPTSSSIPGGPTKADMPPLAPNDRASDNLPRPPASTHNGLASSLDDTIERVPALDPLSSVRGIKCTFDPVLERHNKKGVSRSAKPIYKEFGLVCIKIKPSYQWKGGASCPV
jgi:histone-lysine N-methyltransferase SETD1